MSRRERKAIVNLPVQKTRSKRLPQQAKNVQNAIMDCILEEVEAEKNKRILNSGGATSERSISYGIMDKILKKHVGANPWLTRDLVNNYKRSREKKTLNLTTISVKKTIPSPH